MTEWLWIVSSQAWHCAYVVRGGVVVEAAPVIAKHVVGLTDQQARLMAAAKGWKIEAILRIEANGNVRIFRAWNVPSSRKQKRLCA